MTDTIAKNDLLFHPVHGLCRVSTMTRPEPPEEIPSYTLLPVSNNKAKVRFVVPGSALEESGFSKVISTADGNAILRYFKTGKKRKSEDSQAWKLAELIETEARSKDSIKDGRKRQQMDRAVKGLAGELAFVLELTVQEVVEKIQKNLEHASDVNPLVLTALANVEKD